MGVRDRLAQLEERIRVRFSEVRMKFNWQVFANHAELWIYVLESSRFEDVQKFCYQVEQQEVAVQQPEIWILTNTWTGPWPGDDSEAETRNALELEKRRNAFRQRHDLIHAGT